MTPPSLTTISFWAGALLPVVYLPLLASGVESTGEFALLVALLALNVAALVLGHEYSEFNPSR